MNETTIDAYDTHHLPYFAPLLPWHQKVWAQLTERVHASNQALPHAILAAGVAGIGKREFVWRLVAWLLCDNNDFNNKQTDTIKQLSQFEGACGRCMSCQWLSAGTHPSLQVLPKSSQLVVADGNDANKNNKNQKKAGSNTDKKKGKTAPSMTTKTDDIRQLLSFIHQGSQGMRVCVFDHAEQMTIGAANALLKTLEEPQPNVHLILITDSPAQLLPTIKSRVQQLPLNQITPQIALDYIHKKLADAHLSNSQAQQLLALANGAPLAAVAMKNAHWYDKRQLWLTTWLALRAGKRSALAASDYWQSQLELSELTELTELMLIDINRVVLGINSLQQDLNIAESLPKQYMPSIQALQNLGMIIADVKKATGQNVQDKLAYDRLMNAIAQL